MFPAKTYSVINNYRGLLIQDLGIMTKQTHKTQALESNTALNPLDYVEALFENNHWEVDRQSEDELFAEASGKWSTYRFCFLWREDLLALSFSCMAQLPTFRCSAGELFELVIKANERLWIGHFEISLEDTNLIFRYTLPIRSCSSTLLELIEELVETALMECDRFFPAFHFVAMAEKSPSEALICSVTETAGEA